jgi:flagellar L-ring protein precursor FlgH
MIRTAIGCLGAIAVLMAGMSGPLRAESLYQAGQFKPLFADPRALKVGDIITVLVVEQATAESQANSSEDGDFTLNAGVTDASGSNRGGLDIDTGSRGAGKTVRTGKLRAQLSATVERLLDSGDFLIRGSQLITINGEQQKITVVGAVRPTDISAGNTILSTRIMDARIEFEIGRAHV